MGYRMSVKGTITCDKDSLKEVVQVLEKRQLKFEANGKSVTIDHADRNMTPGDRRLDKALEDLSRVLAAPQAITVWDEFSGDQEVVIGNGRIRTEVAENVWSSMESPPSPELILDRLRNRGISARLTKVQGRRGTTRQFEFQPTIGGPGCRVTVKRRFWDSFDLLAVPDVSRKLCDRYNVSVKQLRDRLHNSTFGLEVRNPADGGDITDYLYEELLDILEDLTTGIRTAVG